ncbi:MAG TPA: hydroxyphenylacetyl-CoA thioesterase PaaI [Puia sp.]|nr:hydroxyphenylacetyl-CoA thioesterase PaaI [Puia sp.]
MSTPAEITAHMMTHDHFSQWLGLQVDATKTGYCKLHFQITDQMLNGFAVVHGGVLFAAADSAFAFACNSHGILTLALNADISFTRSAHSGDVLTVEARAVHQGGRTGVYQVEITNSTGELIALFKGTAYQTSKPLDVQ